MRPILRNIFLLVFVFDLFRAQEDIPSLKKLLATAQNDSIRLDAYWLLAKAYRPIDQGIARRYIDTVQKTIIQYEEANKKLLDYHLLIKAKSLTTLANIEIDNDNLEESIRLNLECAKIYEQLDYPSLIAVSLSNVGAVFTISNRFEDAVTYLKKSIAIEQKVSAQEKNNPILEISMAETMINLGGVYSKIAAYKSDSLKRELEKEVEVSHAFYKAKILPKVPEIDSSINYYEKSLALYTKNKDEDGIAFCYNGIATGFRLKLDFKRSIDYTNEAISLFRKLKNDSEISQSYINFSDLYLDMKNYPKALQYADSVERICLENGLYENLVYTYETKTLAYERLGDVKNQLKYFKKFTKLKDSLNTVNNTITIQELKTVYETEKKEKAITELTKDNEIKVLQNNRLIIVIIAIVAVALLLMWLAIFLQRTIKERKIAYIKLQEKNIEIQKQGELLSEQSKLISKYQSQMNPHFIFNALNSIQGFVVNDEKQKTIDQLQLFSTLMRQTLNNSNDEQITLDTEVKYLKTYVQFEQSRFKDPLTFEVSVPDDHDDILVPPMMIQPFIENCIKHAGLHTVKDPLITLRIAEENGLLKVLVKDNGVGFDSSNEEIFKRSHAVSMIQSRLSILFRAAGMDFKPNYFEMRSRPIVDRGTEVIFYLPLNYKY